MITSMFKNTSFNYSCKYEIGLHLDKEILLSIQEIIGRQDWDIIEIGNKN